MDMIDEIISVGEKYDYAVDMIITAKELDEILHLYESSTATGNTKFYTKLKIIRQVLAMDGVKRLGTIDSSRLNWKK